MANVGPPDTLTLLSMLQATAFLESKAPATFFQVHDPAPSAFRLAWPVVISCCRSIQTFGRRVHIWIKPDERHGGGRVSRSTRLGNYQNSPHHNRQNPQSPDVYIHRSLTLRGDRIVANVGRSLPGLRYPVQSKPLCNNLARHFCSTPQSICQEPRASMYTQLAGGMGLELHVSGLPKWMNKMNPDKMSASERSKLVSLLP